MQEISKQGFGGELGESWLGNLTEKPSQRSHDSSKKQADQASLASAPSKQDQGACAPPCAPSIGAHAGAQEANSWLP